MPDVLLGSFYFRHLAQDFLREKKKSHQSGKLSVQEVVRNGHVWFHVVYTSEVEFGERIEARRAVPDSESVRPPRTVGSEAVGLSGAGEWDSAGAYRHNAPRRRRNGRMGEDE